MNSSVKKAVTFLSVLISVLIVDQWTKHLIHSKWRWGESLVLIQDFFALTYVRNMGAAFGFLNSAPAAFRDRFFLAVPILAIITISYFLWKLPVKERATFFALSLIFSGALGNLIDRLRFGYVIDFLDAHYKEVYHWPVFNVADSVIVVGVGILMLVTYRKPDPK